MKIVLKKNTVKLIDDGIITDTVVAEMPLDIALAIKWDAETSENLEMAMAKRVAKGMRKHKQYQLKKAESKAKRFAKNGTKGKEGKEAKQTKQAKTEADEPVDSLGVDDAYQYPCV